MSTFQHSSSVTLPRSDKGKKKQNNNGKRNSGGTPDSAFGSACELDACEYSMANDQQKTNKIRPSISLRQVNDIHRNIEDVLKEQPEKVDSQAKIKPSSSVGLINSAISLSLPPSSPPPLPRHPPPNLSTSVDQSVFCQLFTEKDKRMWLEKGQMGERGFIRVFDASMLEMTRSVIVPVSMSSTVAELSIVVDALHIVYGGGVRVRRLNHDDRPLAIQNEHLKAVGMQGCARRCEYGDAIALSHLLMFTAGRPVNESQSKTKPPPCAEPMLSAYCRVRKATLLFNNWSRRLCILDNGKLFIYEGYGGLEIENNEIITGPTETSTKSLAPSSPISTTSSTRVPQTISLARTRTQLIRAKHGKRHMLQITYSDKKGSRMTPSQHTIIISFDHDQEAKMWYTRCSQTSTTQQTLNDMSSLQLETLPEHLFTVGAERLITTINLRHNALRERPKHAIVTGSRYRWLDDLSLLQSLRSINLSDNGLSRVPRSLLQLSALTELILSSNELTDVPSDLCKLIHLRTLNLCNNRLSSLPLSLSESRSLTSIDISFNQFTSIPLVLIQMKRVAVWQVSGNRIETIAHKVDSNDNEVTKKDSLDVLDGHVAQLDLRRNNLRTLELSNMSTSLANLTHIDLSYNTNLDVVDLRHLNCIQVVNCERMALTEIFINGKQLVSFIARQNKLSTINIEPLPLSLRQLDISNNKLRLLPEYIGQLPHLERLIVHNNRLVSLPQRLFTHSPSLRTVDAHHNLIHKLPTYVDERICVIDTLLLYHNRIVNLTATIFTHMHRLTHLNISQNFVTHLPPPHPVADLNKVQHFIAASNLLDDNAILSIFAQQRLKTLDLAYNRLTKIENDNFKQLTSLEKINVAGNRLTTLPQCLSTLKTLTVLCAHSNQLTQLASLKECKQLRVIDIANNHLRELGDIGELLKTSDTVRHVDISCNVDLRVDEAVVMANNGHADHRVSLVAVSAHKEFTDDNGCARIPTIDDNTTPWQIGFAETSGDRNRLCVQQLRRSTFTCADASVPHTPTEKTSPSSNSHLPGALIAMVDGGLNVDLPPIITDRIISHVRCEARRQSNSIAVDHSYMHNALIECHLDLGKQAQMIGAACVICHIVNQPTTSLSPSHYRINLANVGHSEAVLCRRGRPLVLTHKHTLSGEQPGAMDEYNRVRDAGGIVTQSNDINGVTACSRQIGCTFAHPVITAKPHALHFDLTGADEFLIIANAGLWHVMSHTEAVRRARPIANALLAAKHLQDMAQSYGYTENLSIIVVRFFFDSAQRTAVAYQHTGLDTIPQHFQPSIMSMSMRSPNKDDSDSDSDAKSEARGWRSVEKPTPNYYFEYKRRLKEMDALAEDGSLVSIQPDMHTKSPVDHHYEEPKSAAPAVNGSEYSTLKRMKENIGHRFKLYSNEREIKDGQTIKTPLMSPKAQGTLPRKPSNVRSKSVSSKLRFDTAREMLIEKLQLRTPKIE